VVAIAADEALGAIKSRTAERGVTAAAGVIGLVTRRTLTGHALPSRGVEAVRVDSAAHTRWPLVTHHTVGLSPTATAVIRWITGSAGVIDALLAVAVTIGPTAETLATISSAERRIAIAAVVIIGVAGQAHFVDALPAAAIGVGLTGHAATAVSYTEWRIATTASVVRRVTGSAGVTDAFASCPATIAITATGHTRPGVAGLDAERCVLRAARVTVTRVTGETVTGDTLTNVRVITIVVYPATDALITVGALHTIGRGLITAAVTIELARLALSERTERLGRVVTLKVRPAIPTDVSVGRLYTER